MNGTAQNGLYTVGQVAELLGCSVRSLYRWEQEGVIPKAQRIDCGAVSTRVFSEPAIDEIQKSVGDRLIVRREPAAKSRDMENPVLTRAETTKRQRAAMTLAGELGLQELLHSRPDSRARLRDFILLSIKRLDDAHWSAVVNRLLLEPGIAANAEIVQWLDIAFSELRKCLIFEAHAAAAALLRWIIEIAVHWASDSQVVVSCIRDIVLADAASANVPPQSEPMPPKRPQRGAKGIV